MLLFQMRWFNSNNIHEQSASTTNVLYSAPNWWNSWNTEKLCTPRMPVVTAQDNSFLIHSDGFLPLFLHKCARTLSRDSQNQTTRLPSPWILFQCCCCCCCLARVCVFSMISFSSDQFFALRSLFCHWLWAHHRLRITKIRSQKRTTK